MAAPGSGHVAYGLAAREVERVDSGYRLHDECAVLLVMRAIHVYGSEAQRRKYLPRLATGEWIGCFWLTDQTRAPIRNPMRSKAEPSKNGYRLTGAKLGSPIVLRRHPRGLRQIGMHQNAIRGFILERGMQGLATQ